MPTVASTDGMHLALHDLGGDGPPALLSHATGFHGHCWVPLASALAGRFHSWAVDFRGHGGSTTPSHEGLAWSAYGDDATSVARWLGLRGGLGVGHSMGGTALLMAELTEPGTFAGLVLYEPIVLPDDLAQAPAGPNLAEVAQRRRAEFASFDEAYANYAAKPPLDVFRPDALRAYVDHGFVATPEGRVTLKCTPAHEAATFMASRSHDTFARLGEVGCPVLVLAGDPTGNMPGAIAPAVAERLARGRLEVFDDLGHFGPMEDPERVAATIVRFGDELGL